MLDEVDVWLPDVAVMVQSVQSWVPEIRCRNVKMSKKEFNVGGNLCNSPVSVVMDQARVDPLLLDDELDLVVEARLVGGGEGEEGHADVDLRGFFKEGKRAEVLKRRREQDRGRIGRVNVKTRYMLIADVDLRGG